MKREKIFIQGYGHSGSSLIRDYIYEFNDIAHIEKNEFDLARFSGGIYEIGSIIEDSYDFVKDSVFRKFLQLIEYQNKRLNKFLGDDFLKLSYEFKDKFIYYTVKTDKMEYSPNEMLLMPKYITLSKHKLINKIFKKLLKNYNIKFLDEIRNINYNKDIFFVKNMPKSEYVEIAKQYLENLLNLFPENKKIALVHPINILGVKADDSIQYWDNFKVVVADKDPRDIYVAMLNGSSAYLQRYKESVNSYIEDFKIARQFRKYNKELLQDKLLEIRCEDFINNYNEVSKKVNEFLNLKEENHINKKQLFNPDESRKFVGAYKKHPDKSAIEKIEQELSEYIIE